MKHATRMAVSISSDPITIPRARGRELDALGLSLGGLVIFCGRTEDVVVVAVLVGVEVGVSVGA